MTHRGVQQGSSFKQSRSPSLMWSGCCNNLHFQTNSNTSLHVAMLTRGCLSCFQLHAEAVGRLALPPSLSFKCAWLVIAALDWSEAKFLVSLKFRKNVHMKTRRRAFPPERRSAAMIAVLHLVRPCFLMLELNLDPSSFFFFFFNRTLIIS